MPVDLNATRALLASVAGFTPGPWGFEDDGLVWADGTPMDPICHTAPRIDGLLPDAPLIAAAPDLHRELTEAVAEIERLRLVVGWAETDALGTSNALVLVTEQAKKDCAERDTEIVQLRAHNARMVAQINKIADACDAADATTWDSDASVVCGTFTVRGGGDWWRRSATALRRLAAGEVDDG